MGASPLYERAGQFIGDASAQQGSRTLAIVWTAAYPFAEETSEER